MTRRWDWKREKIENMLGQTFTKVYQRKTKTDDDELVFELTPEDAFVFFHEQDCCEGVEINEIIGDLSDLVGSPLVRAEERSNSQQTEDGDSETWTFYEFATNKGSVTVRWYGTSNGYYSESVDLAREKP